MGPFHHIRLPGSNRFNLNTHFKIIGNDSAKTSNIGADLGFSFTHPAEERSFVQKQHRHPIPPPYSSKLKEQQKKIKKLCI